LKYASALHTADEISHQLNLCTWLSLVTVHCQAGKQRNLWCIS